MIFYFNSPLFVCTINEVLVRYAGCDGCWPDDYNSSYKTWDVQWRVLGYGIKAIITYVPAEKKKFAASMKI